MWIGWADARGIFHILFLLDILSDSVEQVINQQLLLLEQSEDHFPN